MCLKLSRPRWRVVNANGGPTGPRFELRHFVFHYALAFFLLFGIAGTSDDAFVFFPFLALQLHASLEEIDDVAFLTGRRARSRFRQLAKLLNLDSI